MAKFVGDEDAPEWLNSALLHAINLILKRDRPDIKGAIGEYAGLRLSSFSLTYEVEDMGSLSLELLYFPNHTGEKNYDFEGTAVEAEEIVIVSAAPELSSSNLIAETLRLMQSGTTCAPELLAELIAERERAIEEVMAHQAADGGWTPQLLALRSRDEIVADYYWYPAHEHLDKNK